MFFTRALTGFAMVAVSVTAIGMGGYRLVSALSPDGDRPSASSPAVTQVSLISPTPTQFAPVLIAQGRIQAGRQFRVNLPVSGTLAELNPRLIAGETVAAGELLAALDPIPFQDAIRNRQLDLNGAINDLAEAEQRLSLAQQEWQAAIEQRGLRQRQLERIETLNQRQLSSRLDLETAEVTLATAVQAELAKNSQRINAQTAVDRAQLNVQRAELALAQAQRSLNDSRLTAPFTGVVDGVTAKLGDQIGAGQTLGVLTDVSQLEVTFSTQNPRVMRLMQPDGQAPLPLPAQVGLTIGSLEYSQPATLARVTATGDLASGGRQLVAKLEPVPNSLLRPGDFVQVAIREPKRDDVAWIPSDALSDDQSIFTVQGGRLEKLPVQVLERQVDRVLIVQPEHDQIVAEISLGLPMAYRLRSAPASGQPWLN